MIFKKTILVSVCSAMTLVGCAKPPQKIEAAYQSPVIYKHLSCREIIKERNTVVAKVNEATGQQKKNSTNDAVAMGVGLVLFWPSLFFIRSGKQVDGQLAAYKGQYDALTAAGEQKGCLKN